MTLPPKQPTWNGRSSISTFVHSLHLLDLDLLEDWPGVSREIFSSKSNLQHRMRCVEWSLYRLFEQFDSRLTKEKLLPFFPPTTSLQSINLRAALFRQLTELKKDGRLGQNVVLRKTMLDECKGDKFEELLAAFSILVLKRVRNLSAHSYDVSKTRPEHLLPLIISHRRVIEQSLVERRELKLKEQRQQNSLQAALAALAIEESEIKQQKLPEFPDNTDALRRVLRENWVGDARWVDTILNGEVQPAFHSNEFTSTSMLEDYEVEEENTFNLLHDLSSRVSAQNARLAHWQKCLKNLQQTQAPEQFNGNRQYGIEGEKDRRFSQHQNLDSNFESNDVEGITLGSQHTYLFNSFEQDLAQSKNGRPSEFARTEAKTSLGSARPLNNVTDLETVVEGEPFVVKSPEVSSIGFEHGDLDSKDVDHHTDTRFPKPNAAEQAPLPTTPPQSVQEGSSLLERTKASLAHLVSPEAQKATEMRPTSQFPKNVNAAVVVPLPQKQPDRSSLLERTRESMSLLTNVFEDTQPLRKSGARKSLHSKSRSVNIPSQNRRRERTWSEDSIISTSARDDLDINADYESVFKSRPKLAMSPNLSPQRNDLFDEFLEEGMKKLTIEPSS